MSTMKTAQTVYYGPSTTIYPDAGSVSAGETVTALWKEGNWCYIEYAVNSTNYQKRGYVPYNSVTLTDTLESAPVSSGSRYPKQAETIFFGPDPDRYQQAGSISAWEEVTYLGKKEGSPDDYAFIEYDVTGTSQKKRGWVLADDLWTERPEVVYVEGQRPSDMDIHGHCYFSGENVFHAFAWQCTWFGGGRAYEKCGIRLSFKEHTYASAWYDHAVGYSRKLGADSTPVANSIAVFHRPEIPDNKGHVVFVEQVLGNQVYYTDANGNGDDGESSDDGTVKVVTASEFKTLSGRTLLGYLVL